MIPGIVKYVICVRLYQRYICSPTLPGCIIHSTMRHAHMMRSTERATVGERGVPYALSYDMLYYDMMCPR